MDSIEQEVGFVIRAGRSDRRGTEIRCANRNCSGEEDPEMPRSRFLGVFFPGTRCFIKCYRCKRVNRITVERDGVCMVELEPYLQECPQTF